MGLDNWQIHLLLSGVTAEKLGLVQILVEMKRVHGSRLAHFTVHNTLYLQKFQNLFVKRERKIFDYIIGHLGMNSVLSKHTTEFTHLKVAK